MKHLQVTKLFLSITTIFFGITLYAQVADDNLPSEVDSAIAYVDVAVEVNALNTDYGRIYFKEALTSLMNNDSRSFVQINLTNTDLFSPDSRVAQQVKKVEKTKLIEFAQEHLSDIRMKMKSSKIPISTDFIIDEIYYNEASDNDWCTPATEIQGEIYFRINKQSYVINFKRVFVFDETHFSGIEFRVYND